MTSSFQEAFLGHTGAIFAGLGAILGLLGAILGHLGVGLGSSWPVLEVMKIVFSLGTSSNNGKMMMLARCWYDDSSSRGHLGAILAGLRAILGHLGAILGHLGPILGSSWPVSGLS